MKEENTVIEDAIKNLSFDDFLNKSARVNFVAKQFDEKLKTAVQKDHSAPKHIDDSKEILKLLVQGDPTENRGKFLTWIVRMYITNQFKIEDLEDIKEKIKNFVLIKNQLPIDKRDINQYSDFRAFYEVMDQYKGKIDKKQIIKGELTFKDLVEGFDYLITISEKNFTIVQILTHKAACFFGRQNGEELWCTAKKSPLHWENTIRLGNLYVILTKEPKTGKEIRFQFHFETEQLHNSRNLSVNKEEIDYLSSFPGWAKFLNMMSEKHYDHSIYEDTESKNPFRWRLSTTGKINK